MCLNREEVANLELSLSQPCPWPWQMTDDYKQCTIHGGESDIKTIEHMREADRIHLLGFSPLPPESWMN